MAADNTKTLVRMSNQIADFYRPYGREETIKGVRTHIFKFWTPVMRIDMQKYIASGGTGPVAEVLEAFRQMEAAGQIGSAQKAAPHPAQQGQMASDAG